MHPRPINSRILFSFSLRNDTNEIKLAWLTCLLNNGTNGKGVRLAQRFSQEQGCERCRNLHPTHGLRSDFSSRSLRHVADHATIHESTSEYGGRSLEDSLTGASERAQPKSPPQSNNFARAIVVRCIVYVCGKLSSGRPLTRPTEGS